jgi:signal transduction histidine kinase/DNA-binding response OmpR family regulator/CHASE3 domain sensor protein
MGQRIERRIAVQYGLALTVIVGGGAASYMSLVGAIETTRNVEQTHQTLDNIQRILALAQDAETGQRGYLLTGRERYLDPYNNAIKEIDSRLDELGRGIDHSPMPRVDFEELQKLVAAKLAELNQTVTLRREKGFDTALSVVLTDRGAESMGEIRKIISRSQDLASSRLVQLEATAAHRANWAIVGSIGLFGLAVVVLGAAFRMTTIELKARRQTEERLVEQTRMLEGAQSRLSTAAAFAAGLNQSNMLDTYQLTLSCIGAMGRAHLTALYDVWADRTEARCAIGPDLAPLATSLFQADGLPSTVATTGEFQELIGPFDDERICLRFGLGDLVVYSVAGWPVSFRGRTLGVLVTVHTAPVSDESKSLVTAALNQLAVRMEGYQVEQQRFTLLSDLRTQSRALEAASQEAERANRAKSDFLATMSHELRTPMNSIMGFTARLLRKLGDSLSERDLDALRTVDRNAKHLLNLINDILDLSKIEANKMDLRLEEFDLAGAAREVLEQSAALIDGKPVEVVIDLPPQRLSIVADSRMIRQVLLNLLSNAIKFIERGTVSVRLVEFLDPALGRAGRLSVSDTGPGIRPEDRARLFQRFGQLDNGPGRKEGGTGLGLVLADQMVRLHGGRIEVKSEPGQGSEFAVVLPLGDRVVPSQRAPWSRSTGTEAPAVDARFHSNGVEARHGGQGVRILCVDDEPDVLKYLQLTFEDAGYQVLLAHDFDEAVAGARDRDPDLICLDLAMPGKDGFAVIDRLREHPQLTDIPILVVSATSQEGLALRSGVRRYLAKPTKSEELLEAVRDLLGADLHGHVLIVDDDPDTVKLLSQGLEAHGMIVRTAGNGREALQRLAERAPAVIILDLTMPVMDGFAFLDHVNRDPAWKRIPVIVLSGKLLSPAEVTLLGRCCSAILVKGKADAEQLADAILRVVVPMGRKLEVFVA